MPDMNYAPHINCDFGALNRVVKSSFSITAVGTVVVNTFNAISDTNTTQQAVDLSAISVSVFR
jgi:hypothetical protein